MWRMAKLKNRHGFAMIIAILIAVAMIIPAMIIASTAMTRRKAIGGESISDRTMAIADGAVDMVVSKINKFPDLLDPDKNPELKRGYDYINAFYRNNPSLDPDHFKVKRDAVFFTMGYLLQELNGGKINTPEGTDNPENVLQSDITNYPGKDNVIAGSFWDIDDNVSTYLYDTRKQQYYAVWDGTNNKIASVSKVGVNGDITTKPIRNLATGGTKMGISAWDSNYATDNRWIEIDTNTQYTDDGQNKPDSTKFVIRVSAYPLSNSDTGHIIRNILSEVTLHDIHVETNSSSGSSGSGGTDMGPFNYAVWSGKGFVLNGVHKIQSGYMDDNGNIVYDGRTGSGDIYADGEIIMNGFNKIYGNIATSEDHIITNGNLDMGEGHKIIYNRKETLPDFSPGTENTVKNTALSAGTIHHGDFDYNGWNKILNVNGLEVSYYIDGNAYINGSDTIKFYPITNSDPPVDWYVNGDLNFNGDTVFDFGDTPGIVWVNGNVNFNGNVIIKGSGTIVANGWVHCNGYTRASNSNPHSKLAIISEGEDWNGGIILNGNNTMQGLFYAPHSDIILNGTGSVFGSLVAGGYVRASQFGVIVNGNQNITYDREIKSGGSNIPPVPHQDNTVTVKGVSFASNFIYRLSWREIISKPVTPDKIQQNVLQFNYQPPTGT